MKLFQKLFNEKIFLFISIFVFLATISFTNFGYLKDREYPFGFGDHFSYLIKAKNFEKCWLGDCKGLKSIESQIISIQKQSKELNKDYDGDFVLTIERQKARVFKAYHPLYSFIILGFDQFFDNLLKSRIIAHIIFLILITYSLVLFSNLLFGKTTTILVLLVFAFNNQGGFGFGHQINPYVLSQSLSMVVFYSLVQEYKKNIIIFNILTSLMHPIGIFTNLISLIFTILINFKKKLKTNLLIVLINFTLILFIYFNDFSFFDKLSVRSADIFPNDFSIIDTLKRNIKNFYFTYSGLYKFFTIPIIFLCSIFYLLIKREKKIFYIVMLIYLMIFTLPLIDKPQVNLPRRFMNIGAVIMIGSLCFIFIQSYLILINKLFKKENLKFTHSNYIVYLFPFLVFSLLVNINLGIKNFKNYYSFFNKNYDVEFSSNQTDLIKGENILIFNDIERADYFYMLEGLHEKNYFYYYNKNKKILNPEYLKKNKPLYFVSMTPFYHNEGDSYFVKKDKIEIINDENEETYFKIGSSKKSKISVNGKIFKLNQNNIKNSSDEIFLSDKKIIIEVLEGKIKFLKLGKQKEFNYPWNRKIYASLEVNNNQKSINFKKPEIFNCSVNIVNDYGSSVLYRLTNCSI
tara:strand:+ start:3391 stop:5283 length:1893 start_codon:yes stop_codon:yes gene_type:complete